MIARPLTCLLALATLAACFDFAGPRDPLLDRGVLHPVRAGGSRTYERISAGMRHTCALTGEGVAYCWGANDELQLGTAVALPACQVFPCTSVAQQAGGTLRFSEIVAGTFSTCALAKDGKAWCWGLRYRWLDTLDRSALPAVVETDSAFVSITGGDAHYCGLTAGGTAMCWGVNFAGELGDSTKINRRAPVVVAGNHRFATLSALGQNTCGITIDGDAWCWGDNRWGQLGIGEVPYNAFGFARIYPGKVAGGEKYKAIAVGGEHVCALTMEALARCWGRNENAQQLGDDSGVAQRGVPGPVAGSLKFDALSASSIVTCGHTPENAVHCWGSDYFGALGDGREVNGGVGHPVLAAGGPYTRVASGVSHTCAIALDGAAWCWGDGLYGQTGHP